MAFKKHTHTIEIKQKTTDNEAFTEWKKASLFLISMGLMLSAFYLTDLSPFF